MKKGLSRRDFLRLSGAAAAGPLLPIRHTPMVTSSHTTAVRSDNAMVMSIDQVLNAQWTRKHDIPGVPLIANAPKILYPKSLEELIEICTYRKPNERLKAAGSHWALSDAAISDEVFVETHDPNNAHPAMGRTLYDVVPGCLSEGLLDMLGNQHPRPFDQSHAGPNEGTYLVHFETGKRIYQLYSELDWGDDDNEKSLARYIEEKYDNNSSYRGPWAFETLGGAGGQTVFGALTTGTHGGDIYLPPIADSVMALHLVADGGKHYWIERETVPPQLQHHQLTDDNKLRALYGTDQYGGPDNFQIIRTNDHDFNSVLIAAGRFGIVYSIVIRAVRQYSLHEERRLSTWQTIKSDISNPHSALYSMRFLQIAISLTPYDNFQKNLCGITKRWNVPLAANPVTLNPSGRDERRGRLLEPFDSKVQGPLFERAGNSFSYSPDPDKPNRALPPNFLERACSNSSFADGVIEAVYFEIKQFVADHKVVAGGAIAAVAAAGGANGLMALAAALGAILLLLALFLEALRSNLEPRLGQTLNDLREVLLNHSDPGLKAAGVFVWQCIAYKIFESQQEDLDFEAISYAVMDRHDYFDQSCNVNVDSIEVFFDATDSMLTTFIDALICYEIAQEGQGRAFVGYVSLRFTGQTDALLGMQKFPVTCAVEVACLKDVTGSTDLINYAIAFCLNRNVRGILHWGQRNESAMADIQDRFGDSPNALGSYLGNWRDSLSRITENGRLDGFSSEFTRRVGLEIVMPMIGVLKADRENPVLGQPITILWDCSHNPSMTEIELLVHTPSMTRSVYTSLPLEGTLAFPASERGEYQARLTATIRLNGEVRDTDKHLFVTVL